MANSMDMLCIKNMLLSTQGATGEMLFAGFSHALKERPEERHEMQAGLLKMLRQVLFAAQSAAKVEADETCQRKVGTAEADLKTRKAAVKRATELLTSMKVACAAQKEKLDKCRCQVTSEDEEHKRMEVIEEEKAQELAVHVQGKDEVAGFLEAMAQQGNSDATLQYLRSIDGEPTLVAALRSVLEKMLSERSGFDKVAVEHLQGVLETKVAEWQASVQAMSATKANIHAETLGAWAVKEVAGQQVKEAESELEASEQALAFAQEQLNEATGAEQHEESVLAHYLTDHTLAHERVRECSAAMEALGRLEAGPEVELPIAAAEGVDAMEVDTDILAAKMDAVMDVDMGTPIAA